MAARRWVGTAVSQALQDKPRNGNTVVPWRRTRILSYFASRGRGTARAVASRFWRASAISGVERPARVGLPALHLDELLLEIGDLVPHLVDAPLDVRGVALALLDHALGLLELRQCRGGFPRARHALVLPLAALDELPVRFDPSARLTDSRFLRFHSFPRALEGGRDLAALLLQRREPGRERREPRLQCIDPEVVVLNGEEGGHVGVHRDRMSG